MPVKQPKAATPLNEEERRKIVNAALALIEQVYVHLPLKRAMHAINPAQRLRLLAQQCGGMSEREFHNEMLSIFLRLRDLHTNYILPRPYRDYTAYLPFRLGQFHDNGERKYVVTQVFRKLVADNEEDKAFKPGVIVTHWNGIPIDRAVDINADREAGSNAAARHARGLESLTLRWMGMSLPPDEEWVEVTYHDAQPPGTPRSVKLGWKFYGSKAAEKDVGTAGGARATMLGLDKRAEVERRVRSWVFRTAERYLSIEAKPGPTLETSTPDVFPRCGNVKTPSGQFGYIRIATFSVPDDQAFVREFVRLTRRLNQRGLIIDVRGNPGGRVPAGERLLQCLTPRRIEPEQFHFINSPSTLRIAANDGFQAWRASIEQATAIGTEFSAGHPLLPVAAYNDIGQTYQGPVVLITDALCYSTTDIFAAGFQDHEIGVIIGVGENTGAGGANVWDYGLLREFLPGSNSLFPPLPRGADFRVAVRRTTRVLARSGTPLEDLGVRPDELHLMTRRDVLHGNVDLINRAAEILAQKPGQRLTAKVVKGRVGSPATVIFDAENIDRVDVHVNERPLTSLDVPLSMRARRIKIARPDRARGRNVVELRGYRGGKLVAATRVRC